MPINLKKTDIKFRVDNPDPGYIILGFDAEGQLVKKDEYGNYDPILPTETTSIFTTISAENAILGSRTGADYGLYSFSQGTNVSAVGKSSSVRGENSHALGDYSSANGTYVVASQPYSYAWGSGIDNDNVLESGGKNSFVHEFSIGSEGHGTLSDYSVILGGYNNDIGSLSENSVILGGHDNTIYNTALNSSILGGHDNEIKDNAMDSTIVGGHNNIISDGVLNSSIVGGNTITATVNDAVYVPRIILSDGTGFSGDVNGMIRYNATDGKIEGYVNGNWASMTTTGAVGDFVTIDTTQTVSGSKTFSGNSTFSGSVTVNSNTSFTSNSTSTFNEVIYSKSIIPSGSINFTGSANHAITVSPNTISGLGRTLSIDAGDASASGNGGDLYLRGGKGNGTNYIDGNVIIKGNSIFLDSDTNTYVNGNIVATQTWVTDNAVAGWTEAELDALYYKKETTADQQASALSIAKIKLNQTTENVSTPPIATSYLGYKISTNGWARLFNGYIIQWFRYWSDDDGTQWVTFPHAFPSGCLSLNFGSEAVNEPYGITDTGFNVNRWNSSINNQYITVWAIGY